MPDLHKLARLAMLIFICLSVAPSSWAQRHVVKKRFKPIKISKGKARVVCPIFEESQYPYQGIGVKLGDPFALTYKFYAHKNFAIAIDAGKAASGLYNQYHTDNFENGIRPDTLGVAQSISYLSHVVNSEWVVEGKLLYQHDATKLLKGLQWYIGAGLQWRRLDIEYEYLLDVSFNTSETGRFDVDYTTMGPTAVFGFEYAYFQLPLSAFMEVEMYTDVVEDPGWMRFQGGIGLRVVF
ncbi:MAG: hypothetical protein AAF731_09305 [Bacteroidota bacterium]